MRHLNEKKNPMNIHSIYSLLIFQLFKTCIQPLLLYHHLAFILKLFYMFRFIIYNFGYPNFFTLLLHVHVLTRLFVYLKSSKTVSVVLIFNNKDTCITHLIIQLLNYTIFNDYQIWTSKGMVNFLNCNDLRLF